MVIFTSHCANTSSISAPTAAPLQAVETAADAWHGQVFYAHADDKRAHAFEARAQRRVRWLVKTPLFGHQIEHVAVVVVRRRQPHTQMGAAADLLVLCD